MGDTTLAEITPKLERVFASWKPGDLLKKSIPSVDQPQRVQLYLIDRPGSLQSLIMAAQIAPPRNNPEAVENGLVNEVFGGSFSSRINMNLRENKHWSYGVGSRISSASISARGITGILRLCASKTSGLSALTAEEITTTCAPSTFAAWCPS